MIGGTAWCSLQPAVRVISIDFSLFSTLLEDTLGEPLADVYFLSEQPKLGWVSRRLRGSRVRL